MPCRLEIWAQAAHEGLSIVELPVPLIYLDESRSFGGSLDDARTRLAYYYEVLDRMIGDAKVRPPHVRGKVELVSRDRRMKCLSESLPHTSLRAPGQRWRQAHRAAAGPRGRNARVQLGHDGRLRLRRAGAIARATGRRSPQRVGASRLGLHARVSRYPASRRRIGSADRAGWPSAAIVPSGRVVQELRAGRDRQPSLRAWRSTWSSTATRSKRRRSACPVARVAEPIVENLPLDRPSSEIPYEARQGVDCELLESFGNRAADAIRPLVPNPFVDNVLAAGRRAGQGVQQSGRSDRASSARARRTVGFYVLRDSAKPRVRSAGVSLVHVPRAGQAAAHVGSVQPLGGRLSPGEPRSLERTSGARSGC